MSEKVEHTAGPWEGRTYASGCCIVSKHDRPGRSVRQTLTGVDVRFSIDIADDQSNVTEASGDARLILGALAVPHECDDSACPGNRNRERLELLKAAFVLIQHHNISEPDCTCAKYDDEDTTGAEAWLARYREIGGGE